MPSIALVSDLIFSSKIGGTASAIGVPCRMVRSEDGLRDALTGDDQVSLVVIDLNADGVDGPAAVGAVRELAPAARVVGFLSHVQRDLAEAASAAGAEVMPRSRFVQELPSMLAATAESGDRPEANQP